jgi:hypothetical protein
MTLYIWVFAVQAVKNGLRYTPTTSSVGGKAGTDGFLDLAISDHTLEHVNEAETVK